MGREENSPSQIFLEHKNLPVPVPFQLPLIASGPVYATRSMSLSSPLRQAQAHGDEAEREEWFPFY